MNVRPINLDEDYETLKRFWEAHGWDAPPRKFLPPLNACVCDDDGTILSAAFVHLCNATPTCWMEWLVTNPANRPTQSLKAMKHLVDALKEAVASLNDGVHGYGPMLTTCRQPSLVRLYESLGFERTDENVTHLVCLVPQPEPA